MAFDRPCRSRRSEERTGETFLVSFVVEEADRTPDTESIFPVPRNDRILRGISSRRSSRHHFLLPRFAIVTNHRRTFSLLIDRAPFRLAPTLIDWGPRRDILAPLFARGSRKGRRRKVTLDR